MKVLLIYSLLLCTIVSTAQADILKGLKDKGWSSYYAGFRGSGIEIAVDAKGHIKFYFTPKRKIRINRVWPIDTHIRVERRAKGSKKWVKKKTKSDGFLSPKTVKIDQEKIEYHATATGDVQFKINLEFDKAGVNILAKMIGKPKDADKADYRLILESKMPTLMQSSTKYDEKQLKSKTRGDEVKIEFKKSKDQRFPLYKVTDTNKINAANPKKITIKADKIGRKKFSWELLDPKESTALQIKLKSNKKRLLTGFNINLTLADAQGNQYAKGIRIEYR